MLNNINMEFIQAFNLLYAVPIVAVILCAFIVYAFGFKSPVQPPSFEGIEEEKKYSKKRKAKDNQKKDKLLQNGKVNGSSVSKSSVPSLSKKKESTEKVIVAEKSNHVEKSSVTEKKANKKSKLQNEKKSTQERKKESISQEDFNDDGWVQLVSKKGRKNRKKDDGGTETQSNASLLGKTTETNKSDDSSQVEESPKRKDELPKGKSSTDQKQNTPVGKNENPIKDAASPVPNIENLKNGNVEKQINTSVEKPKGTNVEKLKSTKVEKVKVANVEKPKIPNIEKTKIQDVIVEVSKPDNNLLKQHPKETAAKGTKVIEDSNKSKKKKKKSAESIPQENESMGNIKSNAPDLSTIQVNSEIPALQEIPKTVTIVDVTAVNKVEKEHSSEAKTSNVAFDELAGLYPETKEQKKKKKVRRDH